MSANDSLWYKDAIIYEIHVRAFFDSNGDGIGDFAGLCQKLDYLQDLGVNTLWLLPFFVSPLKDDGYDIADYYELNPVYGELEDFKKFIKEAKKRNIRTIIELVVNHTSDQHEWFRDVKLKGQDSEYYNHYVWSDSPEKYCDTRIIFKDIEKSNWTWEPSVRKYYWHRFFSHQPDLNHNNPEVVKKINDMLDFWLELGVDGFRLDAIPYLCVREGTNNENLPETHRVIKEWRKYMDERHPDKVFLAEANQWPEDVVQYFGSGDECHMAYHFPLMPRIYIALKKESRVPIAEILQNTPEIPHNCQWALFLRNHDELTLEMVTDEERDYMYDEYAKESHMRLNWGIRRRLAPLVDNDRRVIEILNFLLFSLPGTPIIYYGDEIGMGDNIYLGDRNGVRTPMQWSPDRNAGFSAGSPHKLYLPLIMDSVYGYPSVNVESQQIQPNSLLNFMKKMIDARKKYKAFGRGSIKFFSPENMKVLAYMRTHINENILCVVNLSKSSQYVELNLSNYKGYMPVDVFAGTNFPVISEKLYPLSLPPYSFFWFELKKFE